MQASTPPPPIPIDEPQYPTLRLIARHGNLFAIAIGILLPLLGVLAGVEDQGWGWTVAGVIGGLVGWLLMKSYAEIVAVIADTLLPQ